MPLLAPRGDDWAHEPTRFRRALNWFRHRSGRIVLIMAGVWFAQGAARFFFPQSPVLAVVGIAMLPVFVVWVYAMFENGRHTMRWCEECIWKRVGENGAEEAEKRRKLLRLFHLRFDHTFHLIRFRDKFFCIPVDHKWVWGLISTTLPLTLLFTHGVLNLGILAVWAIEFAITSWSDSTHFWYRLNCPWCRGGGGGDDDVIMPDTPVPGTPATPDMVKS